MKRNKYYRAFRAWLDELGRRFHFIKLLQSISREKYDEKLSAAVFYGILSALAINFFYQPGHVYSAGAIGLAQIIQVKLATYGGLNLPLAAIYYAINIPLMVLAWRQIGHKFTVFTFITVSFSTLFMGWIPKVTLTSDPMINALFGGALMGLGIGLALRANISSGGMDVVILTIRKRTGRQVGNLSLVLNGVIILMAGLSFGWPYAFYSLVTLFVSTRVTDLVFTKQRKMQAMIVTSYPEQVIKGIHTGLERGVTILNDAEGAYKHERKAVLITIITRAEYHEFKWIMRETDPEAFVTIADNVHTLGRFMEY